MMTVGTEVLTLYIGKSYLYLIPWFNLWLLCTLGTHNQAISSLILAGDDIRAISYSSIVASVVGLILSWVLIPKYQIGGVCIAFAVYVIIQLLFYYCYYWPFKMGINSWAVFYKSFLPYLILGYILYEGIHLVFISENCWILLLSKSLLFMITYVMVVVAIINKKDRYFLLNIIKK